MEEHVVDICFYVIELASISDLGLTYFVCELIEYWVVTV